MGKIKTMPINLQEQKKHDDYLAFQKIVFEEVFNLGCNDLLEESCVTTGRGRNSAGQEVEFQKHILRVKGENIGAVYDKGCELKELAIANGRPDMFGLMQFDGKTESLIDFIVFNL